MERLAAFELERYPVRVVVMMAAALSALLVDFVSKTIAVAVDPQTLLFNISAQAQGNMIFLLAATSLAACVLPARVVAVGAGVAFGGALGNLTSRHWWGALGGSPDFIPFADGSTGNLADIFIVLGGVAMLLGALLWLAWTALAARNAPSR
jgi:hypothetical protein